MYQIGEVASLARVSVRLLRHYDGIGLLVPSGRSEAGYRLYRRSDLERLQQILFYRSLEFPLQDIQALMNAPDFDRHAALLQQRALLAQRSSELAQLLGLIDRTLAELQLTEDQRMGTKAMFDVFPDLDPAHIAEAEQRWGNTTPWQESARRAARHTKADWERLKQEQQEVDTGLAAVFRAGKSPDSPEALAAVEAARLLIERWHYNCSRGFHVRLTAMTGSDERFVRNIDRDCPGLADFLHAAAQANLARHGD